MTKGMWMLLIVVVVAGAGCGRQFEADYEARGQWSFSGEYTGTTEGCPAELLELLEEGVEVDGDIPEFEGERATGTVTLLNTEIDVYITAPTKQNPSAARPVDEETTYMLGDVEWRFASGTFESRRSCGPCVDELRVTIRTQDETCYPWPHYEK